MQEAFLHHLWKFKNFNQLNLKTTEGESISVLSVGTHNLNSGPDFFNAQLKIGDQHWAGNVEIHINTNDWFAHHHERDKAYDNVILHVVWEDDGVVFRKDNTRIPTLQLKDYVFHQSIDNYNTLFSKSHKWINCEHQFDSIDDFVINNWLERLYFERLEQKSETIETLLKNSKNDWEAVLFKLLARAFGLKINGDAFFSMSNSFEFSVLRKIQSQQISIEALLFGQLGLLSDDIQDEYVKTLINEYQFLKQKFKLETQGIITPQFFRLRPLNFPTIRLAQLASLYHEHQNIFSKIISSNSIKEIYDLFSVSTSPFWDSHYTFDKASKKRKKPISKSFMDLLLINAIIPLKFSYNKSQGIHDSDIIIKLITAITSEKNSIVDKFDSLKPCSTSALQSQALLQLKQNYCDKNLCLQCAVGNVILREN